MGVGAGIYMYELRSRRKKFTFVYFSWWVSCELCEPQSYIWNGWSYSHQILYTGTVG